MFKKGDRVKFICDYFIGYNKIVRKGDSATVLNLNFQGFKSNKPGVCLRTDRGRFISCSIDRVELVEIQNHPFTEIFK